MRLRLLGAQSPRSPMHRKPAWQRTMCQAASQQMQLVHLHVVLVQHVMHMSPLAQGMRVQHSGDGTPAASHPEAQKQHRQRQKQALCPVLVAVLRRAAVAGGG